MAAFESGPPPVVMRVSRGTKGRMGWGVQCLNGVVWPSGWRTSLPALAVTAEALTPLDDTRLLAEGVRGME